VLELENPVGKEVAAIEEDVVATEDKAFNEPGDFCIRDLFTDSSYGITYLKTLSKRWKTGSV
jgi:hypothetical protein